MIIVDKDHFGCAAYRSNRGCSNGRKLRVDRLEKAVLDSLKETLLTDHQFATFADEYRQAHRAHLSSQRKQAKAFLTEIRSLDSKIDKLVIAITEGADTPAMRKTLVALEDRKAQAVQLKSETKVDQDVVALLPNLPEAFRRQIERLETAIESEPAIRDAAAASLRSLIDTIIARPIEKRGSWSIKIMSRPGALHTLSTKRKQTPDWVITLASPRGRRRWQPIMPIVVRF